MKNSLFARYFDRCGARNEKRGNRELGCHVQRQTRAAIGRVFTIETCRGFRFPGSAALSPVAPRILGVARKADDPG